MMKYLVVIAALMLAVPLRSQTIDKPDSASVYRSWGLMHEYADSTIVGIKRKIAAALLEPDLCYRPNYSSLVKKDMIPVKKLRADLAQAYKHRDNLDKEYAGKLKMLAAQK